MCSGFEAFDLEDCTLDPTITLAEIGQLGYARLSFKGGDRSRDGGKTDFLCPGAFETEFLVQNPEEFRNGEVESSL